MKSILIIGAGNFGSHLCKDLAALNNEIMIVDKSELALQPLLGYVTSSQIADCTNESVLRSFGIPNFDICFVCIGGNFQASLIITSYLKEHGARYVVSKTNRDIDAKFLLHNGADEVIYPDRDISSRAAIRFSADKIFDYIELSDGYSIYEILPLPSWIGKSIKDLDIRGQYRANIISVKHEGQVQFSPSPDYVFRSGDHMTVVGHKTDIENLISKFKKHLL